MGTDEISKDLTSQIPMDNSIWYFCKHCRPRRAFQHKHQLIEHKKTKHYDQLLQASNERKLAKKKLEEETKKDGNEDTEIEKVDPSETVTSSATSPSEDQNQNNINMLVIGVPIPVSVQLNLDPNITDDKKSTTELSRESESLCNLNNQDFSSHDDVELSLNHSEIENNNVGMEENSAVPLIRVAVADDAGADMDINLKLDSYDLDLMNALSSPSGLELREGHCQPLTQSYDLIASAVATLTNTGTSHRDRDEESDSEIECVFDSHRPLGSPMKPLSPTPGPVPAAAASVRTWNIKDFKGAFAKFLPPVPILTGSGFEYENENPKTCASTGIGSGPTTTTTSGPDSSSISIKRKFLSLSSSPDYQDLDSTKEIVAKLEVLGQHQYCPRCFKMFLRPSSYKAHRKICHLKTVSSFQEFKSKFQIEIRSLPCHHQQSQTQQEQQSHVPNSKSNTANYSPQMCNCGKKRDVVDHVLVKIPDCDQIKGDQGSQSSSSDELPSQNKIRKIQTRQQQGGNNLDNKGNSSNQNQSDQMSSETQQLYKCKLCGSSFEYKTELTSHLLVHMSASPDRRSEVEKSRNKTVVGQSQNPTSGTISTSKQVIEISDGRSDSKSERNKNNKPSQPSRRRETPLRYRICNRYRYNNRNRKTSTSFALASSPSSVMKSNKKSDGSTFSLKKHLTKESKPNIFYRFHTRGKPFSCPLCSSASKSKSEFCLHMKSHRRNRSAGTAGNSNSKTKILNSLNRSYQEESSICKVCLKSFYKFEDLLQHLRNHRFSPVPIIMEDQY